VEGAAENSALNPPQPLGVERESGSLTVSAEDTLVEVAALTGLRQVNAPDNAVVAYRFNARPFTLALKLKHIEPVIAVTDRVNTRLEETRFVVAHSLTLNVEKAGIYALELTPQPGFAVADVRGDGIEDWKMNGSKLAVNFSQRVLGVRQLDVQLEQALKTFPEQIAVTPLRVTGAAKESSQIGAAAVPGIRLKTASIAGLREIPSAICRTARMKFSPTPPSRRTGSSPLARKNSRRAWWRMCLISSPSATASSAAARRFVTDW